MIANPICPNRLKANPEVNIQGNTRITTPAKIQMPNFANSLFIRHASRKGPVAG